jgi:hypothetical protein
LVGLEVVVVSALEAELVEAGVLRDGVVDEVVDLEVFACVAAVDFALDALPLQGGELGGGDLPAGVGDGAH